MALRRSGKSRREIKELLGISSNSVLDRLLDGAPPPTWTRRPRAKDEVRLAARERRARGLTMPEIAEELGVSKSSVSRWVRDMPRLDRPPRPATSRWESARRNAEVRRQQEKFSAGRQIGQVSDRELWLAGVVAYMAEGAKDKRHSSRRSERVVFINSDQSMILLFLAWLDLLGVSRDRSIYRLSIHETADIPEAERVRQAIVNAPPEQWRRPSIKRHNPRTVRASPELDYHGCLIVSVRRSADLYRRIEGWWFGLVQGCGSATRRPGSPTLEALIPGWSVGRARLALIQD